MYFLLMLIILYSSGTFDGVEGQIVIAAVFCRYNRKYDRYKMLDLLR